MKTCRNIEIVTATIDSEPSISFVENIKPSLILVTLSSVPVLEKLFTSVDSGALATGVTVRVKSPPSGY